MWSSVSSVRFFVIWCRSSLEGQAYGPSTRIQRYSLAAGLVSLIDNAADARPKTIAPKITVFAFISSSALGRIQLVTANRVSFLRNSCRGEEPASDTSKFYLQEAPF